MEAATAAAAQVEPTAEVVQPDSGEVKTEAKIAEAKPKKELRKAKIDGKEVDVDIDEVLANYQKYTAGSKRLEEAALKEKNLQKWLESSKENPWQVLEALGFNPDELSEQRLLKKLEYEMLSPEAKKAKDLEREAAELKAKLEEAEKSRKDVEDKLAREDKEKLKSQYAQELDEAIPKFFKEKNIEATPEAIVYAIESIIAHAEEHGEELDISTALETATERFDGLLTKHVSRLKGESLLKLLTPEQLEAIRKHQLETLQNQNPLRNKAEKVQGEPQKRSKFQRMRTDDFFKSIDRRYE